MYAYKNLRKTNHNLPSRIIQRTVIFDGEEISSDSKEDFFENKLVPLLKEKKLTRQQKTAFSATLYGLIADTEHTYNCANREELFSIVLNHLPDNTKTKINDELAWRDFHKYLCDNIESKKMNEQQEKQMADNPEILAKTPDQLVTLCSERLGLEKAAFKVTSQSPISQIAGPVLIEAVHTPFKLKIEIHPKGGIHYGAYFLIEFSDSSESKEWKWVSSKRASYLELGESRTHTFAKDSFYEPTSDFLSIKKRATKHPLKGTDTPVGILQVPIQDIFKKKEMLKTRIWDFNTKASVNLQRGQIRRMRLESLGSRTDPTQRILYLELELLLLKKALLSLQLDLLRYESDIDETSIEIIEKDLDEMKNALALIESHIPKRPEADEAEQPAAAPGAEGAK